MAPPIPTIEPTRFAAGDTTQWRRGYGDYAPSDGYALRYYFGGPEVFQASGTDTGTDWLVTLSAAATADLPAGDYRWRAKAEKGTGDSAESWLVGEGSVTVLPNFATATGADLQTHAQRMLAAIEARLEGRLDADVEQYGIAGRQVQKIPFERLSLERAKYADAVRIERTGQLTRRVDVTFTPRGGGVPAPFPVDIPWWWRRG